MRILEVGPRDGLQNEPKTLTLDQKVGLITNLLQAGLTEIEVGSFVKKGSIPQLAGTAEVLKHIRPIKEAHFASAKFWAFAPNQFGLEAALKAQVDAVAFFAATSESFLKKNINRSFSQVKVVLKDLMKNLPKNISNRVYLSTLVYCPFEGEVRPERVFEWVDFLLDAGFTEIALSDTTGHAHPHNLRPIFKKIQTNYSTKNFALHFHDTRGTALVNTACALEYGFDKFDSSLGGLGGCPYAPGATGNLGTEDLLYYLQSEEQLMEIDLLKLAKTSRQLEAWLGHPLPSRVLKTLKKVA